MKPFFSIYPSCRETDGIIESDKAKEEEVEEEEEEEEPYWCDKARNRTQECQNWIPPDELAKLMAERAERRRRWEASRSKVIASSDDEKVDLDEPVDIIFWEEKAHRENGTYPEWRAKRNAEILAASTIAEAEEENVSDSGQ